jgi:hypothetical protein
MIIAHHEPGTAQNALSFAQIGLHDCEAPARASWIGMANDCADASVAG